MLGPKDKPPGNRQYESPHIHPEIKEQGWDSLPHAKTMKCLLGLTPDTGGNGILITGALGCLQIGASRETM